MVFANSGLSQNLRRLNVFRFLCSVSWYAVALPWFAMMDAQARNTSHLRNQRTPYLLREQSAGDNGE